MDRIFSVGPSCKGKVAIFLGFSFAFLDRPMIKTHEGKQQTAQIIDRKNSGIPYQENRKYLHLFWQFWKAKLISRIYTVPSIISAIYDFKIVTPEAAAPLPGHTQVAKWRIAMIKN